MCLDSLFGQPVIPNWAQVGLNGFLSVRFDQPTFWNLFENVQRGLLIRLNQRLMISIIESLQPKRHVRSISFEIKWRFRIDFEQFIFWLKHLVTIEYKLDTENTITYNNFWYISKLTDGDSFDGDSFEMSVSKNHFSMQKIGH